MKQCRNFALTYTALEDSFFPLSDNVFCIVPSLICTENLLMTLPGDWWQEASGWCFFHYFNSIAFPASVLILICLTHEVSDSAPLHHSHQKISLQLTSLGFSLWCPFPRFRLGFCFALITHTHWPANTKHSLHYRAFKDHSPL